VAICIVLDFVEMKVRIATWNLQRPRPQAFSRNGARAQVLRSIAADLYVLTETSAAIVLDGYAVASAPTIPGYHRDKESVVSICTRWPLLASIDTGDAELTICREVQSPYGRMIFYGVVIPYAHYRGKEGTSQMWVEHRKTVQILRRDLLRIRAQYPRHNMVLAGDFNQTRADTSRYADNESVEFLTSTLVECEMACVTDAKKFLSGTSRVTVDHILCRLQIGIWGH